MKVKVGKADEQGCGHYRVKYPTRAVLELGVDAVVIEEVPGLTIDTMTDTVLAVADPDCDVICFQRPLKRQTLEMIPKLQRLGVAVVVDIDDDFGAIDRDHLGWASYEPRYSRESNRTHLAKAAYLADWVTVTTPALASRYGGHRRCSVVPNFVPASYERIERADPMPGTVIGWPGHVATHPHDLEATCGGVAQAVTELGAKFRNVGDGDKAAEQLGLSKVDATGAVAFNRYPYEISRFDVGIVPLTDTKFNAAKSCLKGLELAAMGVPFAASRVADYERLEKLGIGMTVKPRARNWRGAIKLLACEAGKADAQAARERVFADLTYEHNAQLWVDAWEQARNRRSNLPLKRRAIRVN